MRYAATLSRSVPMYDTDCRVRVRWQCRSYRRSGHLSLPQLRQLLRQRLRLLVRRTASLPSEAYEQRQQTLRSSYGYFCRLSQLGEIDSVLFSKGTAYVSLKDGRRYWFDACSKAASMYTVPHIGTFEAKETSFVRGCVRPGHVCVDAGASFGWYTVLLSKLVGRAGHVHAFEPVPHNRGVLSRNVDLNQCANVTLSAMALDASSGQRDVMVPDIGVSGSFFLHAYRMEYETIRCATTTLDSYCFGQGIERVDFIKADIEGAEWPMLQGATYVIDHYRPVLLLEIQRSSTVLFGYEPLDLFRWLEGRGYAPYVIEETGSIVAIDVPCQDLSEHNFVFLPKRAE